jgi:predicted dinucleotide-binding enzyme
MIEARVPGDHDLFICGNDAAAKREVTDRLCEWFGWKPGNIIDLGDITNSRGTEMFLALWGAALGCRGTSAFQRSRRAWRLNV